MIGITGKNTTYRKNLEKRIERKRQFDHPVKKGVLMQAHHLISAKAIKDNEMEVLLKKVRGYDINHAKNLVFLPSTLPGACHLEVQLHRGDHKFDTTNDTDDDGMHSKDYHEKVEDRLRKVESEVRDCESSAAKSVEETYEILNKVSKKILNLISWNDQFRKYRLPLTRIFDAFEPGKALGCGNCFSIPKHVKNATPCESIPNRNHEKDPSMYKRGTNLDDESFKKQKYELRPGK